MKSSSNALFTFWLGPFPLASPIAEIGNIIPIETLLTSHEELQELVFLGIVGTAEGPVPVVDGCAIMGLPQKQRPTHILLLRHMALGIAVSRLGDVLAGENATKRPLPAWLIRYTERWGIAYVVEAQGLWFVIYWPHTAAADWLRAWQLSVFTEGKSENATGKAHYRES